MNDKINTARQRAGSRQIAAAIATEDELCQKSRQVPNPDSRVMSGMPNFMAGKYCLLPVFVFVVILLYQADIFKQWQEKILAKLLINSVKIFHALTSV